MSVEFKDYYATLGISRDASEDEIKKAFRKLARQFHPDVAHNKATAEEKFKEINEAHEVLSDPGKRKKYDQLGANWRDTERSSSPPPEWQRGRAGPEFHFGGTGFSDFFEQFFGGGNRFGYNYGTGDGIHQTRSAEGTTYAQRGNDIEGDILVTLDEAMHGTVRPISMQIVDRSTGKSETRTFKVRIPPGATDGRRIRVPGHGESGPGGAPAGDLFLRIRHAAHPDFSSHDSDIFYQLNIAPWEAVLGAEIVIPTLDGSVKIRIPAHAENGQKLRVRGRGLPKGKTGKRGDFYVVVTIQLPKKISSQERTLWEKLRDSSSFQPRTVR